LVDKQFDLFGDALQDARMRKVRRADSAKQPEPLVLAAPVDDALKRSGKPCRLACVWARRRGVFRAERAWFISLPKPMCN